MPAEDRRTVAAGGRFMGERWCGPALPHWQRSATGALHFGYLAVSLLSAIGLVGCTERAASGPAFVTSVDGQGVAGTTSNRPLLDDTVLDTRSVEPHLTFGSQTDARYAFTRIYGLDVVGDSLIAVANSDRPAEILLVDFTGEIVARFGGDGEGPGDFLYIGRLWHQPPDTLVAYDPGLKRVTLIDFRGNVVRVDDVARAEAQAPSDIITLLVWGRFADGSYLMVPNQRMPPSPRGGGPSARSITRYDPISGSLLTIGSFPHAHIDRDEDGRFHIPNFGALAMHLAADSLYVTGYPDSFSFTIHDLDGRALRRVSRAWRPATVRSRHREALVAARMSGARDPDAVRQRLAENRTARLFPAFARHGFVSRDGFTWIPHYERPGDDGARWSVFDAEGRWLQDVVFPVSYRLHAATDDAFIGVATDSMGVEFVSVYRRR